MSNSPTSSSSDPLVDSCCLIAENTVNSLLDEVEQDSAIGETSANASLPTSVMLRNIPNKYTRAMLIDSLKDEDFDVSKHCNNLYLPMDTGSGCNLGFCFLNFHTHDKATEFMKQMEGVRLPSAGSRKVCSVVWANRQGVFGGNGVEESLLSPETATPSQLRTPTVCLSEAEETPADDQQHDDESEKPFSFPEQVGTNPFPGTIAGSKLFVGGLSANTTEDDMRNYFSQFGKVREASIVINRQTGVSRGFGFCEFYESSAAQKVLGKKCNLINGRSVSVRLYNFTPVMMNQLSYLPLTSNLQQQPDNVHPPYYHFNSWLY
jgi:RNA recognition motif-containing protein